MSSETILRWTRRGDVPAIRLPGGALRYERYAVDAWLASLACATGARPLGPAITREDDDAS